MNQLKNKILNTSCFEDNQYIDLYCALITANKDTPKEKYKTDKHHIIPKSYYKHCHMKVDNSPDNLVNLSLRDHILAHFYLYNCSKDGWLKRANILAIERISSQRHITISIETIPEIADEYEKIMIEKRKYASESQQGENNSFYGKKHTEETKRKLGYNAKYNPVCIETRKRLREAARGKHHSDEWRKHQSHSHKKYTRNLTKEELRTRLGKAIVQIDIRSGVIIAEYNSLVQARDALGVKGLAMGNVANGKTKQAYGYYWRWKNEI